MDSDSKAIAEGVGSVILNLNGQFYLIRGVLYMPNNDHNTLSPAALKRDNGFLEVIHSINLYIILVNPQGKRHKLQNLQVIHDMDYLDLNIVTQTQDIKVVLKVGFTTLLNASLLHQRM